MTKKVYITAASLCILLVLAALTRSWSFIALYIFSLVWTIGWILSDWDTSPEKRTLASTWAEQVLAFVYFGSLLIAREIVLSSAQLEKHSRIPSPPVEPDTGWLICNMIIVMGLALLRTAWCRKRDEITKRFE